MCRSERDRRGAAGSIVNAGLDPDNLPTSDPSKMNFGSGSTKAWRDIWGCGQGIGGIHEVTPVAAMVERFAAEYAAARQRPCG
jgi:nitronate monooxygenase